MAEKFLSQLLRLENSVQSDESQQCSICLEKFGTLSSETGILECEIRLPCNPKHTVGSACIAKWLKSKNSCPLCRHEYFPQVEPDNEEDHTEEDDTDEEELESQDGESDNGLYFQYRRAEDARAARMSELVLSYSTALHLDDSAIRCSQYIGHRATRLISLIGRSEITIAAASVYLASHLRNQPKTLREVSQILGNTEGAVQAVYRRMYAHHHHMLIPLRGEIFGYRPDPADGRSSNWPPLEYQFVNGENDQDEGFINALWSNFSIELHLPPGVMILAKRMAAKMEIWPALAPCDSKSLVSISIYLASHIAGAPVPHGAIADLAGFHAEYLLGMYHGIYDDRWQLVDDIMALVYFPPRPRYHPGFAIMRS